MTGLEGFLSHTVLLLTFLRFSTTSFETETPDKQSPLTDDPLPQSHCSRALTPIKSVPENIGERMKLAAQWVWEEYPDQVLIHGENVIKCPGTSRPGLIPLSG